MNVEDALVAIVKIERANELLSRLSDTSAELITSLMRLLRQNHIEVTDSERNLLDEMMTLNLRVIELDAMPLSALTGLFRSPSTDNSQGKPSTDKGDRTLEHDV